MSSLAERCSGVDHARHEFRFGDEFVAKMGAEAIFELLRTINLNEELKKLREE